MKKQHRHIGSLRIALTLFVFLIMTVSGIIAACVFLLARRFGMIPPAYMATIIPIMLIVGSVLLGTFLSMLVGSKFLRPIRRLSQALDAVSGGDFSVRVPVSRGPEELVALQESFNHMAEDLSGIEMFRNDFIDSFSHEFKTPIVSIRGFARQLARDSLTDKQRRNTSISSYVNRNGCPAFPQMCCCSRGWKISKSLQTRRNFLSMNSFAAASCFWRNSGAKRRLHSTCSWMK